MKYIFIIPPPTEKGLKFKILRIPSVDKDVEQLELSDIANGNVERFDYYEKQFVRFFYIYTITIGVKILLPIYTREIFKNS